MPILGHCTVFAAWMGARSRALLGQPPVSLLLFCPLVISSRDAVDTLCIQNYTRCTKN